MASLTNLPPSKASASAAWKSAIFIIFVEFGEKFSYYGVAGILVVYLNRVLGQPMATAAKNVNIWRGVSAVFPLIGGFLADSYLGRFNTIVISSVIYLLGLIMLVLSVEVVSKNHRSLALFISLYIIIVGEGGHRPCVQTFAADQFDEDLPEEKAAKSSFFNWWYVGIVLAATSAILVVAYVQNNIGWGWGFSILAVVVAVALAVFLLGKRTYRREVPVGSPFTRVAQVVVAAVRKRRLPAEGGGRGVCVEEGKGGATVTGLLARTNEFRFLDKATIIDEIDASTSEKNPWRLCSVNQVEEVKLVLRLIPIWLSCLMFAVVIAQLNTYYTKQATTLILTYGRFHLLPVTLQVIPGLTILAAVPFYERILVPAARNLTNHPTGITTLQRIGIGIFLSSLTMIVSAMVESRRVSVVKANGLLDKPDSVVPMYVWWLVPQYMLMGLSDVFTIVGMQELFYDQAPEAMRSMGAAAYLSGVGVGSFLSSIIITVVQAISDRHGNGWLKGDNLNRDHLDYFYWVLACLSGLSLVVYVVLAKGFVYKKLQMTS